MKKQYRYQGMSIITSPDLGKRPLTPKEILAGEYHPTV